MNDLSVLTDNAQSMRNAQVGDTYCSFAPDTVEGKKALYKAMSEADCKLSDVLGQNIDLKDIYVEMVNMLDNNTGEYRAVPRVVLFDRTGKSYAAISWGLMRSVEQLLRAFGAPSDWGEPVTVQIAQQSLKEGKRTFRLKVV